MSSVGAQDSGVRDLSGARIHFMGAGGIGVSALMELARARGALVSGCDACGGGQVPHLREAGIPVSAGHEPRHAESCDGLVYSAAVPPDHPEIARARALGKPVLPRMKMLGRLADGTRAIGVTGSHGKTTLTWMIAHLLIHAGRDPWAMVGGVVPSLGSNVRIPRRRAMLSHGAFVLEVDESDNRLQEVRAVVPVVTNIDRDHLEHFGGLDEMQRAVTRWLCGTRTDDPLAALIGCGDDPRVAASLAEAHAETGLPYFDYGFEADRAVRGFKLRASGLHARFDAAGPFGHWKDLELPLPGRHNVANALGAIAAAWRLGLDESTIRTGLATVERVGRRFEIKGHAAGVTVVDDYGHHPREVAVTIASAHQWTRGRVGVLFQPHRYSRTQQLMDEFARAFAESGASAICVLPVYAASEKPIEGADHHALVHAIRRAGFTCAVAVDSRQDAVARLSHWAQEGDLLLTQGAGDVTECAGELLAELDRVHAQPVRKTA